MKKWFIGLKLSQQIAMLCTTIILVLMSCLCVTVLYTSMNTMIKTREREAQTEEDRFMAQVGSVTELCNMSTQVFINTPALTKHLSILKTGHEPDTLELLEFYREDLVSLEKIVLSNPNLEHIRIYAEADGIREMVPILYSA